MYSIKERCVALQEKIFIYTYSQKMSLCAEIKTLCYVIAIELKSLVLKFSKNKN